ncbi:nucleotidyltransferase family protein [Persicitalea sp.]|uniref:nucleotidyltransferase family protein n=1 Tax=Persicitalea sp. TaxID=3100273 RepID=UPI003593FF4B
MKRADVRKRLSPELALLVSSCLGEPSSETPMPRILGDSGDRLLSLARWHNVRPALLADFRSSSDNWVTTLRQECLEITLSNLINTRETIRLVSLLQAEGISAYGYKGCVWAEWLHGQQGDREYGDIDLLVGQKDYLRALGLISRVGYEADPYRQYLLNGPVSVREAFLRTDYHVPMLRKESGSSLEFVLEMHWRVAYPRLQFNFPESEWLEFKKEIYVQGKPISGFSNEYQFLLLIMHHGGKEEWLKLKYLSDLSSYLDRHGSETDWKLVEELAGRKGMLTLMWQGLGLLRAMGKPWRVGWADVPPVPVNSALLNKWENMPRASENSSLSYFYNTLATRDTFEQKIGIGISHFQYASELRLLYRKFLWYREYSK